MELFDDYRTKKLKNRIAGRWFPEKRSLVRVLIETIGRSMAMTLRVLLRKEIGIESYNFWMVLCGLLWLRMCVALSAHYARDMKLLEYLINPLAFTDVATGIINVFSLLFLLACIWYFLKTEFGSQANLNVDSRGESTLLAFLIHEDAPILLRKSFVQAVIAPLIGLLVGFVCSYFPATYGTAILLFGSSTALLIDEINYHRAMIRLRRIIISKENKARNQMAELRKMKELQE